MEIVYVHFAYHHEDAVGISDVQFRKKMITLRSRMVGFAPAGKILDYMLENKKNNEYLSPLSSFLLDITWILDRLKRR